MAMGRSPAPWLAFAGALGLVACGLNFDRYDPAAQGALDGGLDAPFDVGTPETAAADAPAQADAAGIDVVVDVAEESEAAPACSPTAGVLAAPQATGAITIDGDLGDWGTPALTILDANDAALISGPNGNCTAANATSHCLVPGGEKAEIALLRDSANLYVAVQVTVAGVGGTNTTSPYLDDAVEIYLRGDAVATGNYTSVDHQYVVTWQNLVLDYGPSVTDTPVPNPPGVTTAVKVAAGNGGYVVEVQIALSQLGRASLAPGDTLGLDVGIDHGQGTRATRSLLVWWMATHGAPGCTNAKCSGCSPDQPYCDTLNFGVICAD